ncbi:hypothetical protein [Trichormus sp. NMC-1]|uniref:hypothetical protein n=1 Tax=Trichormus sp. NMC-1 TaxID=1853259 RepID=UPI0008DC0166|nr:hypothetical protein [Trichormus sp. NMC-1]
MQNKFYSYEREQGTGNREQGTGNREQGTGNREQGTGNREQGTGNREQGTGNREQGTGKEYRHFYFQSICTINFAWVLSYSRLQINEVQNQT